MTNYRTYQANFSSGVQSTLNSNVNTQKYKYGLSKALNMFYDNSGTIFRRHGVSGNIGVQNNKRDFVIYKNILLSTKNYTSDGNTFMAMSQYDTIEDLFYAECVPEIDNPDTPQVVDISTEHKYVETQDGLYLLVHDLFVYKFTFSDIATDNEKLLLGLEPSKTRCKRTSIFEENILEDIATPRDGDVKYTVIKDYEERVTNCFDAVIEYGGRMLFSRNSTIIYSRSFDSEEGKYRYLDLRNSKAIWDSASQSWRDIPLADLAGEYTNTNTGKIYWFSKNNGLYVGADNGIFYDGDNPSFTSDTSNPFKLYKVLDGAVSPVEPCSIGGYFFFVSGDGKSVKSLLYSSVRNNYSTSTVTYDIEEYLSSGIKKICSVEGNINALIILTNDRRIFIGTEFGSSFAWSEFSLSPSLGEVKNILSTSYGKEAMYLIVDTGEEENGVYEYVFTSAIENASWRFKMLNYPTKDLEKGFKDAGEEDYPCSFVINKSELPSNGETSQGNARSIRGLKLDLYKSMGKENTKVSLLLDKTTEKTINFSEYGKSKTETEEELFSGIKDLNFSTNTTFDDRVEFTLNDPYPFCVKAIIADRTLVEA